MSSEETGLDALLAQPTHEAIAASAGRLDALCAQYESVSDARREAVRQAIELGADDATCEVLIEAVRVDRRDTIVLPPHRLEGMSRGKGWCRKGRSSSAVWGERDDGGYRVGPGKWTVGGNDGFSRKGEVDWTVEHVTVGPQTWTVAS